MKEENLIKTVRQYSHPLPEETVSALRGIAEDYRKVKNYVYNRYAGINSISKLTPGYDIQTEMRDCGLRQQLNLPVVYYELAIFAAIKDIKTMWGNLKNKIRELIAKNENLTPDDRLYLRTVLKLDNLFYAILTQQQYELPDNSKQLALDFVRLNRLLCRLVRRHKTQLTATASNSFKVSPNGYSYKNGGVRLVGRVARRRIFIPLKDERVFKRQITVSINGDSVVLIVPVDCDLKQHDDYVNTIFIRIGYRDMFTLSSGSVYGAQFNKRVSPETDRLAAKNRERYRIYKSYSQNRENENWAKCKKIEKNNLGKKKYNAAKKRNWAATSTYINSEINRMLRTEKAGKIVICKRVNGSMSKLSKRAREKLTRGLSGYLRSRLEYKCRLNGIELVEINPSGTATTCSICGGHGKSKNAKFICDDCGGRIDAALNAAKNIEKRYCGS